MGYKKVYGEPMACKFNAGVDCDQKQNGCMGCGWNPDVAKYRTDKFCRKYNVTVPVHKEENDGN